MTTAAFHDTYRPRDFADVIGQTGAVASIQTVLKRGTSHAFLLAGPSGTGKTTISRIIAKHVHCLPKDIQEVNAAKFTGVDDMREITAGIHYRPIGRGRNKALIVDECHMLSKSAWNSLLKDVEEPPKHIYWFFCTTEIGRVPRTIQTRCACYTLSEVDDDDLMMLAKKVVKAEGIKTFPDVLDVVVSEAHGSPRQMLVNLAMCEEAQGRKSASKILRAAMASDATLELCRFVTRGGSWHAAMAILEKLKGANPESVRIAVVNYVAKVLTNTTNEKTVGALLFVLDCFEQPFNQSDQSAPLLLAVGRALYGSKG